MYVAWMIQEKRDNIGFGGWFVMDRRSQSSLVILPGDIQELNSCTDRSRDSNVFIAIVWLEGKFQEENDSKWLTTIVSNRA